jgi:hypothetical protein
MANSPGFAKHFDDITARNLRVACALSGYTMRQFIREAIKEKIERLQALDNKFNIIKYEDEQPING